MVSFRISSSTLSIDTILESSSWMEDELESKSEEELELLVSDESLGTLDFEVGSSSISTPGSSFFFSIVAGSRLYSCNASGRILWIGVCSSKVSRCFDSGNSVGVAYDAFVFFSSQIL